MGRLGFPGSIVEFQERFGDEAACLDYLAASRWPGGYRCPACGGGRAWVLDRRHLWECAGCHHQVSVTAGTVMHKTHTSLRLWLWAAYLVATHTPGISAKQLQRQLGLSRYETAWLGWAGYAGLPQLGYDHRPIANASDTTTARRSCRTPTGPCRTCR